jgi:hypothetical protein
MIFRVVVEEGCPSHACQVSAGTLDVRKAWGEEEQVEQLEKVKRSLLLGIRRSGSLVRWSLNMQKEEEKEIISDELSSNNFERLIRIFMNFGI